MRPRFYVTIITLASTAVFATAAAAQAPADPRPANNPKQEPAFAGQTDAPEQKLGVAFDVVTVAEGLQNPWGIAFLPNGKSWSPSVGTPARRQCGRQAVRPSRAFTVFARAGRTARRRTRSGVREERPYGLLRAAREQREQHPPSLGGKFVDDATAPRVEDVQVIYHQRPSMASPFTSAAASCLAVTALFITRGSARSFGTYAGAEDGQRTQ
jgi:hypothetical protein